MFYRAKGASRRRICASRNWWTRKRSSSTYCRWLERCVSLLEFCQWTAVFDYSIGGRISHSKLLWILVGNFSRPAKVLGHVCVSVCMSHRTDHAVCVVEIHGISQVCHGAEWFRGCFQAHRGISVSYNLARYDSVRLNRLCIGHCRITYRTYAFWWRPTVLCFLWTSTHCKAYPFGMHPFTGYPWKIFYGLFC